jgi:hypothetical protein
MNNIIEIATAVNASVHEVDKHNSVIVFTETQLNEFANRLNPDIVVFRQLWLVLSKLRRSSIDYLNYKTQEDNDELVYFIGKAYDVLQENEKLFFNKGIK